MKPAPFTYHRAESVDHAVALLGEWGEEAKLLAGGQSLVPMLNLRVARPSHLIDINDLLELDSIRLRGDHIAVGAMTRHHRLADDPQIAQSCPILCAAAASIGHEPIRQRGTLGGSLSHADPAAQLPLIATLLNADIGIASPPGSRHLSARDFFRASLVTALRSDEMITSVAWPILLPGTGWAFEMFAQRRGDFAIASVALLIALGPEGTVSRLSIALGGMASVPLSLDRHVESFLHSKPDAHWRSAVAEAVVARTEPGNDPRLLPAYRKNLADALVIRALEAALARCTGAAP